VSLVLNEDRKPVVLAAALPGTGYGSPEGNQRQMIMLLVSMAAATALIALGFGIRKRGG
jgi:hypothetical protein